MLSISLILARSCHRDKLSAVVLGARSTTGQIGGREWRRNSRDQSRAENSLPSYFGVGICEIAGKSTKGLNLSCKLLKIIDLMAEKIEFELSIDLRRTPKFNRRQIIYIQQRRCQLLSRLVSHCGFWCGFLTTPNGFSSRTSVVGSTGVCWGTKQMPARQSDSMPANQSVLSV